MFQHQPQFEKELLKNPYRRVAGINNADNEIIRLFHIQATFQFFIVAVAILVLLLIVEMAWDPIKTCFEEISWLYLEPKAFKPRDFGIYVVYIILTIILLFMGTLVITPLETGNTL